MEDITKTEEARHLTIGGQHFRLSYLEEDYSGREPPPIREAAKTNAPKEPKTGKVLVQLKNT